MKGTIMDKSQSIAQELAGSKGFKKYFKGGFGKSAKEAEALWNRAEEKGVFAVAPVADFTTTGVGKVIYAFSVDGNLEEETIGELMRRAGALSVQQVNEEDRGFTGRFAQLKLPAGHALNKKGDAPLPVYHLADGLGSARTFPNTSLFFDARDAEKSRVRYVLYAKADGEEWISVLDARQVD